MFFQDFFYIHDLRTARYMLNSSSFYFFVSMHFIHRLSGKFLYQCSTHHNPLVRQIGDYTIVDLQHRYKKYIHRRTKHLLL